MFPLHLLPGPFPIPSLPALPGQPVLWGYSETINGEGEILCRDCEKLSRAAVVPEEGQ